MKINSRSIVILIALVIAILSFQITPAFGNQQDKRPVNKKRIKSRGARQKKSVSSVAGRSASANGQSTASVRADSEGQSNAGTGQSNGQTQVKPLGKSPSTPKVGAASTPPKAPSPIR